MKKKTAWIFIILLLVIGYLMGPKPAKPEYSMDLPSVPEAAQLNGFISSKESQHKIKPENEARVVWCNDSSSQKTEYSIVYLHGFSASREEGAPLHRDIARQFGCNLFLSRLAEHGLDTIEPLRKLTADKYWESAKEALAIGKQLGNKVILLGSSTGATNALQLAANFPNDVHALILLSPNIAINDPNAWLINNPWGLQIARVVQGSRYNDSKDQRDIYKKYWYSHYRLEGVAALQEMLESSMTRETFSKIKQPTLMLYYYKDEIHQDSTVKVSAMRKMFSQLATDSSQKREKAMPNAGDHVISSPIKSRDVEGVKREIELFLKEIIGLKN